MPTFRSNSSSSTNLTVNITQIDRGDGWVKYRCNWSVTTGSATSLGNASGNWRNLRIYTGGGALITDQQIKAASQYWYSSSTYSGSFDFTLGIGTNAAGSASMYIRTNDTGTQSCIWTNPSYCTTFSVGYSEFYTDCGAPANPTVSPNAFENSVTFSWGAAADGVNNAVQTYHLYYRINGGAEIGIDTGKTTSKVLDTSGIARDAVIDFHIAAIARVGHTWSGWSNQVRKNRVPNTPTSPSVPKTSYIPGEAIPVSFANTGDPDGNLAGFEVATDQNETIVGTNASASATSVNVNTTGWPQGAQRKFRVRGYDAHGVRGAWSNYTATVTLNTDPVAPAIAYPAAGSTVYNQRPHILAAAGAANDGPKHILCINDGTEKTTAANGAAFSSGTSDNLAGGRQVVYLPPANLSVGAASITARMYDSFLYSAAVNRAFSIAALTVTDPNISTAGMKIKAIHITDLQTAINALRAAYGLTAAAFTAVVAGVTPIGNVAIITELQTALQAVIDRINGWDSATATHDLTVAWINPAAAGGGVDSLKLRQAIEQLRAVIPTI